MRARRRLKLIAAAAVALIPAALLLASSQAADPVLPRDALRLQIASVPVGRPVPTGYIGLSIELTSLYNLAGADPAAPDPLFVTLARGLDPGQRPVLRFGGDTTDWTAWRTGAGPAPPGIRHRVGTLWARMVAAVARAMDARVIVGINFEADSRQLASTEARGVAAAIGARYLAGLELGNEPELYGQLSWYSAPHGQPVFGRPPSYGFDRFLADYHRIAAALPRGVPLVGPASGAADWITGLGRFLDANPRVRLATFHRYPLHRCFTPLTSPDYPTIPNLLASGAASGPATSLAPAVAAAHAHGISLRADELNSVSCGGKRGVSDTFASALWVLDTLFEMVRAGVDGVNLHTFERAVYEPFGISRVAGRWRARVKPLYYGLLAFARAAPPGSRLLHTLGPRPSSLRIWATRAPDGSVHVVLIDLGRRAVTVAIAPPGPAGSARVALLRAPGLNARGGVTLGGQSFGAVTTTAQLRGQPVTSLPPRVRGRYLVRVPGASAALLTLDR